MGSSIASGIQKRQRAAAALQNVAVFADPEIFASRKESAGWYVALRLANM
jgi:hypothetical protein